METFPPLAESPFILFASIPLYGHFGPLIQQARELARRGFRVAIASTDEARPHIEDRHPGVEFVNIGKGGMDLAEAQRIVERVSEEPSFLKGMLQIVASLKRTWPALYDGFSAAIERRRPDLMVVDFATTAGLDAAESAGVPFLVNNADLLAVLPLGLLPPADDVPMLFSGKSRRGRGTLDRLLAPIHRRIVAFGESLTVGRAQNACRHTRGLAPIDLHARLADRRILVNSAFGIEYRRALPPEVHLVGPQLDPAEPALTQEEREWLSSGPPVVYVNFGTLATPSRAQLSKLVAGLASTEFRVLWVLRPPARDWLPSLPDNVRLEPWVSSQRSVLAHDRVRAFVSHCGTNSVQESLWAGTPIVGFPMFGPQKDMGLRIVDAGVGLLLDKTHFTSEELHGAIRRLLTDRSFADATVPIRRSFEEAGGVRRAADLIAESARWGSREPVMGT